jgi:uncharacterized protein DUF4154
MNNPKHAILFVVLALRILCCSTPAGAENPHLGEGQVKAAFVFNVARYVSWPFSGSDPFVIGVLGRGAVDGAFQGIRGKSVHGRVLEIRKSDDLDDLLTCQVIFIMPSKRKNIARILLQLQDYPVLTISDMDGFAQTGGMVHLIREDDRIRFKINRAAAQRSGLKISSQLLKLAKEVIDEHEQK